MQNCLDYSYFDKREYSTQFSVSVARYIHNKRKDQLPGLNSQDPGIDRTHIADELKGFCKETVQRQELYHIY